MAKLTLKRRFIRERLRSPSTLRRQGFTRPRTKNIARGHRLVLFCKPGRRRRGGCRAQANLHPLSERGTKFACQRKVCRRLASG